MRASGQIFDEDEDWRSRETPNPRVSLTSGTKPRDDIAFAVFGIFLVILAAPPLAATAIEFFARSLNIHWR